MRWRACLAGLCVLAGVACGPAEPARKPNVVLFSIDTLRADALGAYGESRATSPTFDAFAREAIVFEHALSPAGVTAPAHMSILTGLSPTVHRVSNANRFLDEVAGVDTARIARFRLDERVPTLASALRAAGWSTGAFVGGGNLNGETGFGQGFDTFDSSADNGMNGNREQLFDPSRALAWIESQRDAPFFAFLHTYVPHAPYLPPPPWDRAFDPDYAGAIPTDRAAFFAEPAQSYSERFKRYWGPVDRTSPRDLEHLRAAYAGDVRHADDALKAVLDALVRLELEDDTIVIVLSDHGEEFLEHGHFEHPGDLYVEHVHVPLALRVPGRRAARIAAQVGTQDLLPTVLELVGVPAPPILQGRSLVELFSGGGADRPVISETVYSWAPPGPNGELEPDDVLFTLRTEAWTYLWTNRGAKEREELFDRRDDPRETRDVHADLARADVLAKLREALARHRESSRRISAAYNGPASVELDRATIDELRALGYVK